jgi:hypothetical protein
MEENNRRRKSLPGYHSCKPLLEQAFWQLFVAHFFSGDSQCR